MAELRAERGALYAELLNGIDGGSDACITEA